MRTGPPSLPIRERYAAAEPFYQKALAILGRRLTTDHPDTLTCGKNAAANGDAQAKEREAEDRRVRAVNFLNTARLRVGFAGP
jgi:hypothetical protein